MTKIRYATQEILLTTKYVADMNAMDIAKIAATTSFKAQPMADLVKSPAINDHMRMKAPIMEQYIAMESQTMKTWNARLFPKVASPWLVGPLSELLKPPGTVKPAAKVTVATSAATTEIKSTPPLICSKFGGFLARSNEIFFPFSLKGVPADPKAQSVVTCMEFDYLKYKKSARIIECS